MNDKWDSRSQIVAIHKWKLISFSKKHQLNVDGRGDDGSIIKLSLSFHCERVPTLSASIKTHYCHTSQINLKLGKLTNIDQVSIEYKNKSTFIIYRHKFAESATLNTTDQSDLKR